MTKDILKINSGGIYCGYWDIVILGWNRATGLSVK
jgi:hypothetical protein